MKVVILTGWFSDLWYRREGYRLWPCSIERLPGGTHICFGPLLIMVRI